MMNKKLLLLALPALMVMSSCTYMESATKVELFKESTVANENIFGELQPMNLGVPDVDPGDDPSWTKAPKVGVQFQSYTEAEVDYLAVRFVAAIANTDGMTATWSRAVSEKDSNQIKPMAHDKVSSEKYDALNNGGSPKEATSEGTGYNKYVVYSIYDIPATQDESYIAAYLTLSKAGETDVVSKVVVTQLDGSHYFSFDASSLVKDGYFLQSSTAGIIKQKADANTDPTNAEKDNAFFDDAVFAASEKFGLFRFTTSVFQFYGFQTFVETSASRFVKSTDVDQYGEFYLAGTYDIYMNKDNLTYITPVSVDMDLYLVPNDNWKQEGDGHDPRFALYAYGESDTDWFDMVETAPDSGIYKVKNDEKINLGKYTTVIFCRMNGNDDKLDNIWANKYNQTSDLVINGPTGPANMSQLKYSVEGWDNGSGTWSSLS